MKKVLVAVTGSVAAIKLGLIIDKLKEDLPCCSVKVIATENATKFFKIDEIHAEISTDDVEWQSWEKLGDEIVHIELCKWADIMIIAPLDANTLAKIANGICDNLLTCVVRAWRRNKPLLFAPAMNSYMYDHPLTTKQLDTLRSFGYVLIPPVSKTLACGEFGLGAMAPVDQIVESVKRNLYTFR